MRIIQRIPIIWTLTFFATFVGSCHLAEYATTRPDSYFGWIFPAALWLMCASFVGMGMILWHITAEFPVSHHCEDSQPRKEDQI